MEAAAHTRYRALEKKYEQLLAASIEGGDAVAVAAHEEALRLRQRVHTLQAILDAERGRRPGSGLAGAPHPCPSPIAGTQESHSCAWSPVINVEPTSSLSL